MYQYLDIRLTSLLTTIKNKDTNYPQQDRRIIEIILSSSE
nr:MAG TPA: hypothetical protein [Crassvirales sp.]